MSNLKEIVIKCNLLSINNHFLVVERNIFDKNVKYLLKLTIRLSGQYLRASLWLFIIILCLWFFSSSFTHSETRKKIFWIIQHCSWLIVGDVHVLYTVQCILSLVDVKFFSRFNKLWLREIWFCFFIFIDDFWSLRIHVKISATGKSL